MRDIGRVFILGWFDGLSGVDAAPPKIDDHSQDGPNLRVEVFRSGPDRKRIASRRR